MPEEKEQINDFSFNPSDSFEPFRMGIVKPETAIISKPLEHLADSVELNFEREYYKSIIQLEELIAFKGFPESDNELLDESNNTLEIELKRLKEDKEEILNFKYFELLSSTATVLYKYYFYASIQGTEIIETPKLNGIDPIQLMDSLNFDYLLIYDNIQINSKKQKAVMKLRETLFSAKTGKAIILNNTESDSKSKGGIGACSDDLTCLIINTIRQNIDANTMEIRSRQLLSPKK